MTIDTSGTINARDTDKADPYAGAEAEPTPACLICIPRPDKSTGAPGYYFPEDSDLSLSETKPRVLSRSKGPLRCMNMRTLEASAK